MNCNLNFLVQELSFKYEREGAGHQKIHHNYLCCSQLMNPTKVDKVNRS